MRKKGFTLIELLAVIVILSVIALIATPTILQVIEKAKKEAVEQSALGYIDAIEKQIVINETMNDNSLKDGQYQIKDIEVPYKGEKINNGQIVIEKGKVTKSKLCINKYSIDYTGNEVKISNNNYCSEDYQITLNIGDNKQTKNIGKKNETTFDLDTNDINNLTNISCNNGSIPSIENNILKITNIYGDTVCTINNSLESTISNLNNTETNVVMINDEELENKLIIKENNNVILDLSGKSINMGSETFNNYGNLKIVDVSNNGMITSKSQVLYNSSSSSLNIENVKIVSTSEEKVSAICTDGNLLIDGNSYIEGPYAVGCHNSNNAKTIINNGTLKGTIYNGINVNSKYSGNAIINDGYIFGNAYSVVNNGYGVININGGTFISQTKSSILNWSNGTINIYESGNPIYISSLANEWKPAVQNYSSGVININGNIANECTNDSTRTTTGLCIYAEGNKDFSQDTSNTGIANVGSGMININGGTVFGGYFGISNHYAGQININNLYISSGNFAVTNVRDGNINICNSQIHSLNYHLYSNISSIGVIHYSSDTIFINENNTLTIGGNTNNIVSNYIGSCYNH